MAARALMGAPAENSEAVADARRFGFPEGIVAAIGGSGGAGETEIWPENWDTVVAFLVVSTQWRTASMPTGRMLYIGLDYAGARAGLDCAGIEVTPELWLGLRIMEDAARAAVNER